MEFCFGKNAECKLRDPLCGVEFVSGCLLMVLSFVWFVLCLDGLNKIPKCRYGEDDCYFVRTQRDFNGQNEGTVFKNRAVEGDSDSSLEQLAIPFLVTMVSLFPPFLVFLSTIFNQSLRTIEIGKYFLTACSITMLFSIRIVDQLTFDCRWWNNSNQDKCKTSFNTYVAGAFFTILTQLILLTLAVFHGEKERNVEFHEIDNENTGLAEQGLQVAAGTETQMNSYSDRPREAGAIPAMD